MAEDNKKKKNTKIKASTGAWWKSTVVEDEKEAVVAEKELSSPEGASNKKESTDTKQKSTASTSTGRKRSPRKSTPKAKTVSEEDQPGESETASRAKPRGAKNRPKKAENQKSRVESITGDGKESISAQELKKDLVNAGSDLLADQAQVEVKPTSTRAKAKGSSRNKKTTTKPAEVENKKLPEEPVDEKTEVNASVEITEEKVKSDGVKPAVKKTATNRKPRGRKKAQTTKKDAEKPDVVESDQTSTIEDIEDENSSISKVLEGKDEYDTEPENLEQKLEDEASDERVVLKLLINAEEPEECRLALLENGRLESIHVSTINRTLTKNNIYKGRIVAIEPNLQAAFVDYGTEKNGFLPFSEIHPEYYRQELSDEIQNLVDTHQWKRLSITDVVEKGQDVLVQVVKEEVGKKGANMTTYLSLPGRSVVLMPGSDSSGISRKISGEERRSQLRTAMNSQNIPEGIGWIVRTASADITKTALARDVTYLLGLWEEIKKKAQDLDGIGQVYEDHQSVLRFLRENFDPDIEEILVDDQEAMDQVNKFISLLPSKHRNVRVRLHKGARPIFNQYSIEDQIESIYQPRVNLPSGGSIVIDPTEALVAIDVNSGSTSKGKNFDQSIFQANMEAASELARQLRLRDLGGLIVVDFIDMRSKKHIREVEKQVRLAMKRDKAKVDFSRISKFGLMQISRQKLGSPIEAGNYRVCKHCKGRGIVRSVETLALFYLRRIQTGASRKHVHRVECRFPMDVAQYLLNKKRHEIQDHESRYNTEITIIPDTSMSPVDNEILLLKKEKEPTAKKQA